MHWNSDWHMGWMGWMGWMALWWMLIIFPVLIAATWFALSAARRNGAQESAKQALKRRNANRELDRATHERMLEDLRG